MRHQAFRGAVLAFILVFVSAIAQAAPYAAMVVDAKSGKVLHSRNADTRLHPASLTKMMTLYVVFGAIRNGEISETSKVKISKNAASKPPSKLGLRPGSTMMVRHLIRGTAVKSANDAATALAEAVSGSEAAFAKRMTRQAKKLGMKRTTFKNAHGLTQSGHMSTARDMTILGQRLMDDYPEYYNLFSRKTTDAGIKQVANTNRRLLNGYRGADGIKTGYTSAAGFNLVASAEQNGKRVIATVFGGKSSADRYSRVANLLDLGFGRASAVTRVAKSEPKQTTKVKPKVIRVGDASDLIKKAPSRVAVKTSLLPRSRPTQLASLEPPVSAKEQQQIEAAIIAANLATLQENTASEPAPVDEIQVASAASIVEKEAMIVKAITQPDVYEPEPAVYVESGPVVVERVASTAGSKAWAVQLGAYGSRYQAEKVLLRTALADLRSLDGALRKIEPTIIKGQRLYRAQFVGISKDRASKTCARLNARSERCTPVLSGG
ncbi:serine-type D-Ala-D-Ala carboxypeptidase [Amylibacter ulvae]|uniref:Serine-type D-Ala-D-Ala carboxypeptidase n=1 Tax=Paramylibacter ulvae TaxID=1651968 RepID=A0ABQ3D4T5_9RHOB|nr:serine hydrolase [Amylibacter ulvae]GHA57800.1 serine-type D-Ala-D-Ala carboxypeptidase [Amylibacter ulvae]